MFIRKLKNGNYVFRESYKNPITNKWHETSCTFGKNNRETRKQAQIILDKRIRTKLIELESGETDITFAELKDKYLEIAQKQLAYNTYYRKKTTLNKISYEWGKDTIAKNVTPQFINKYLDNMLYCEHPYANETVNSYKSCIGVVYEMGIKYGYISNNPIDKVKISWKSESLKKREEIENKYLDDNELERILKDCDERKRLDLKEFFEWMYLTGMRCGEAAAIQKKNILQDKDGTWFARVRGSLITIRNEPDPSKRHIKTKNAKTYAGDRDVTLPPEAITIAKNHCKDKKANDFIFTNNWKTSEGYFNNSKLNKVLKSIMKRQKIKKKLVTHIFRHTHVSKLAEMGVPLYVIQQRVGHGDSRITRRIYLHITKKVKKDLANKLQNFSIENNINNSNVTNINQYKKISH